NKSHTSTGNIPAGIYDKFIASDLGKMLAGSNKTVFWVGRHKQYDSDITVNTTKYDDSRYAISVVRKMDHDAGYILVDVSMEEILKTLNNINFGDGCIVTFITSDGREIAAQAGKTSVFAGLQYFRDSVSGKETSGYSYEKYNGKEYLYSFNKIG